MNQFPIKRVYNAFEGMKRMHLIYVDESGTPDIKDSENFVIAAVIINEDRWFEIEKRVNDLKQKYFSDVYKSIEIHMSDIVHRKNEFLKIVPEKRADIIRDIFEIVKTVDLRPVYCVIRKANLRKSINIRYWGYRYLFERLCSQLKELNQTKSRPEYGLLVIDSISKDRNQSIYNLITDLLKDGSGYEKNEYLIEAPIFSESHIRSPLQIADCIAYVINHNYKTNKNKDENIKAALKEAYQIIDSKITCCCGHLRKVWP